jgi:putative hydrolase of the HAD superfamily
MPITTVGLDADDTLWHNETIFRMTHARFAELLAEAADPAMIEARLAEVERRNLRLYGYGVKGFTLSMIETAMELTDGRVDPAVIRDILAAGRDMLAHPVEPLSGVEAALAALSERYRLVLITKGDLLDQERKLAASGLGDLFAAVEIVSEKTCYTYGRVFARHGSGAGEAAMIGRAAGAGGGCLGRPRPLCGHLGPRAWRRAGGASALCCARDPRRRPGLAGRGRARLTCLLDGQTVSNAPQHTPDLR